MPKRLLPLINLFNLHSRQYSRLSVPLVCLRKCNPIFYAKILLGGTASLAVYAYTTKVQALAKDSVSDKIIIEEADQLYDSSDFRNLYVYLKSYANSENANLLWRLARAARDLALKSNVSAEEKKELVYEAFDSSKRALAMDEENFAAHKWYAITIGDVGDYEGVKVKISNAYIIRDHLQRATQLNPKDATTLHCLGMWCFAFADMPRWQHMIAGVVFATPPTSTYAEAIDYFSQAERADPNFYSVNLLMLGKSYMKVGDKKRAMLYLDRTINYPCVNNEDKEAKADAEKLLKELLGK